MKFNKKNTYYRDEVYEFSLPVGHTCPGAETCLVRVNRKTGKQKNESDAYKCYAASAERFPGVREHRWKNFEECKNGDLPMPPEEAKRVRIHPGGDFFNQKYFDNWLAVCVSRPKDEFWAYTKSLLYWQKRLGEIPKNLQLTASFGGKHDHLILELGLKHCIVVNSLEDAAVAGLPVDYNDDLARNPAIQRFALVENRKGRALDKADVHLHNEQYLANRDNWSLPKLIEP